MDTSLIFDCRVMNLPLGFMLGGLALVLAGCGHQDAGKPSERFPGFTQVADTGEAAELFFHRDSARRDREGWVSFVMIRVVPGGYVLQQAETNCLDAVKAADGMKFRDDGTLSAGFPGDPESRPLAAGSPLFPLTNQVCRYAEERRKIVGDFDPVRALDLLYGPFRPELQAALWEGMAPPLKLSAAAESMVGKTGIVRVLVSREYQEAGKTRHILLTATKPSDKSLDCRSCAPLIGGAVFVREGESWQLEREFPYLGFLGLNGAPPELSWEAIGRDRHAIVAKIRDRTQGILSIFIGVYELADEGWKPLLQFSEQGEQSKVPVDLDIRFGDPDRDYSDATIEVTGRPGPGVPDRKEIFRFRDGRYVSLDEFFKPPAAALDAARSPLKTAVRNVDPLAAAAEWRRKKELQAQRALLDYASAVSSRNLPLALAFWSRPSEKVIRTIQNTEYLAIRVENIVPHDVDGMSVSVEMEGKPRQESPKVWRGAVDMELRDSGEWRIVSMARLKCVQGCDGERRPSARSGGDDGAAIKAVVQDYFSALDRRDPETARLMRKAIPAGFDDDVRHKEFAKVTRMEAPIVQGDQASVWVNVVVKDFGRGTETLQGALQLGREGSGGWQIVSLAALTRK